MKTFRHMFICFLVVGLARNSLGSIIPHRSAEDRALGRSRTCTLALGRMNRKFDFFRFRFAVLNLVIFSKTGEDRMKKSYELAAGLLGLAAAAAVANSADRPSYSSYGSIESGKPHGKPPGKPAGKPAGKSGYYSVSKPSTSYGIHSATCPNYPYCN